MDPVSRRSFLLTSSAGAAAIGVRLASPAAADDPEPAADQLAALDDPAVLQVRDSASGEVELLVADRSIVFNDKRLVARLLRATR